MKCPVKCQENILRLCQSLSIPERIDLIEQLPLIQKKHELAYQEKNKIEKRITELNQDILV